MREGYTGREEGSIMKFCKTVEAECKRLHIPRYPYKEMKKMIKAKRHDAFLKMLERDIPQIDSQWKIEVDSVLRHARLRTSKKLRAHARTLLDTAYLYKEATRKILKKQNKQGTVVTTNVAFEFQELLTIQRLRGVSGLFTDIECCVCLDVLFGARALSCGHVICAACHDRGVGSCPMCRRTGKWTTLWEVEPCLRRHVGYAERRASHIRQRKPVVVHLLRLA